MKGFASDNNSGVSPEILAEIAAVNTEHVKGYGDDPYTQEAIGTFREIFGEETDVFFTLTGTGSNTLAINASCLSFQAVICAHTAHINEDECGSPEKLTGCKLIAVHTPDGKLTPELVKPHLLHFGDYHHAQPHLISITQVTEMGTLYTTEEVKALADLAHSYNMLLHMDGARIANAAASLGIELAEFTSKAGVDIRSN